jgi:hypothetical protein
MDYKVVDMCVGWGNNTLIQNFGVVALGSRTFWRYMSSKDKQRWLSGRWFVRVGVQNGFKFSK